MVQSREKQPVDETTPTVGSIVFERVRAEECRSCAVYALGLPERPIERIRIADCRFGFVDNAPAMVPAMAEGVPACHNRGVIAEYVSQLKMENVTIEGITGPEVTRI